MSDFSQYQGPSEEWEAFVQSNPLPPPNLAFSPQVIREVTNGLRIKAAQDELEASDLLTKVSWRDYSVVTRDKQNIIIRVYRPNRLSDVTPLPVYLYFHGGGMLFGTIETEDAACSRVAYDAGILVANVGYRHTPEFKHPTQVNDAWDSFKWLKTNISMIGGNRDSVIVGGISAGASLAAFVVTQHNQLSKRSTSPDFNVTICGQLLVIPWLVHPHNHPSSVASTASYRQNVNAHVLPLPLLELFTDLLGCKDPKDPSLNAGTIPDAKVVGLPKTSFLIAGQDLLRDEGLSYAQKLEKKGIPTKVHVFPGLPHGFRLFSDLRASKRWDDLLIESCKWFLSTDDTSSSGIVVERG